MGKIRFEINGIIQDFKDKVGNKGFLLKNRKIEFFDKDNNRIAIKELSVGSRIEMKYK